jgi:diguanylate cyclase (GGDEF)-like protein
VDFITKPFNGDIVRLRIRNHLELKFLRDRQTQLALLDGLTGLPNRRSFDATLGREWLRASRGHKPLALAMIDIDHFKAYNDSRGHLQGDDCLKQVAATLAAALVRPADFVARFGGEEFCCILPETSLTDALGVTERLRSHIENLQLPHGSSTVGPVVTISAGVASQFPTPEDDPKTWIGEADRLLYLAKQSGRNRVAG